MLWHGLSHSLGIASRSLCPYDSGAQARMRESRMKPNHEISPELLENRGLFRDPFYQRFTLRAAAKPLQLTESIQKDYLFPTFYGDVTCAMAIFLCPWERAAAMMPHPSFQPVRMPGGRAAVAFSCYEYKQVLGVPPYNEIAMTIPVLINPGLNIPLLPLITPWFKNFGYYVFSMPVTSLENQIRGVKIWGLPKVVQGIDVVESGGECVTTAYEESGEEYFRLRVPTTGTATPFDVKSNLYSVREGKVEQSETNFKATFNVTKFGGMLFGKSPVPERPYLTLGNTPSGQVIQGLELDPHPFQLRFARGVCSCFDFPNPGYTGPV